MTMFRAAPFIPVLDSPLYQQLYAHLRTAILTGKLTGGTKLPSTRTLADELGVSRNTVLNAYEQLRAEGYLESSTGSGTFVAQVLPETLLGKSSRKTTTRTSPPRPHLSKHATLQLAAPPAPAPEPLGPGLVSPFRTSMPALDAFPYKVWSQLIIRQAKHISQQVLQYQEVAGYRPLREAIATHITLSRQVQCSPEQIIIVAGSQGGLDLVSRLFLNAGDAVWVEDPGYFGARGAFLGAGAHVVPVPVDCEGLVVEAGIKRAPKARLVHVTASHQFPLGVTMSVQRRLALLEWANCANAYILEDDYDSEYRYSGRPLAALQGLDDTGRVIYIGTFSKVFFPALRIGYLVLPTSLVEPFLTVRHYVDVHPPILEQAVLTDFIREGHFERHIRRMRKLYAERRAALLEAIKDLPLEIDEPEAGLRCIGWLPEGMDDVALVQKAAEHGLELWPVSAFSIEPIKRKGILLGYGGSSKEVMQDGVRRLAAALGDM
jgi:GntR family transcriptional regulator / MocR family aminotransferase